MTDRELLTKVRDLLAEGKRRLARRAYARSARGRRVVPDCEGARCWCVLGAIRKVGRFYNDADIPKSVIAALYQAGVPASVVAWSDDTPYPEIIATLARAAELAGSE